VSDTPVAAVGALLAGVKVNQGHPDEVVLVLKCPGTFREVALQLGNFVGYYFEGIAFMNPIKPLDEA
jgi:hypothetical protein